MATTQSTSTEGHFGLYDRLVGIATQGFFIYYYIGDGYKFSATVATDKYTATVAHDKYKAVVE